jgi:hypothetical protein
MGGLDCGSESGSSAKIQAQQGAGSVCGRMLRCKNDNDQRID